MLKYIVKISSWGLPMRGGMSNVKMVSFILLLFLASPLMAGCKLFSAPLEEGTDDTNDASSLGTDGIPGSPDLENILPTLGNVKMTHSARYKVVVSMNSLSARTVSQGKIYTAGNSSLEPLIDILFDLDDEDLGRLDLQENTDEE